MSKFGAVAVLSLVAGLGLGIASNSYAAEWRSLSAHQKKAVKASLIRNRDVCHYPKCPKGKYLCCSDWEPGANGCYIGCRCDGLPGSDQCP
jgi:hypothetical protein